MVNALGAVQSNQWYYIPCMYNYVVNKLGSIVGKSQSITCYKRITVWWRAIVEFSWVALLYVCIYAYSYSYIAVALWYPIIHRFNAAHNENVKSFLKEQLTEKYKDQFSKRNFTGYIYR